jgi:hypothetical protein
MELSKSSVRERGSAGGCPPMASAPKSANVIRFGLFEVDLHARELRKSGVKLKIHEQPSKF